MTTILHILYSLVIGGLVSATVYVVTGVMRRSGSESSEGKGGTGGKPIKKKPVKKKPKKDDDDDLSGGRSADSGLTPTREWVGGSRG